MKPIATRRRIRSILTTACLVLASANPLTAASDTPNVILLMSDDQGWGDVGFNGHPDLKTPHLDAMAAAGTKFNRFYAAAPLCSPTRGSCLTGRYPFRYGILAAHTGGMRVGELTIPELLKQKDYQCAFFGKWHIGWVKPDEISSRGFYSPPSHHGFDHYFATTSAVPTWDPLVTPKGWTKWGATEGEPWKDGAYVQDGSTVTENLAGDDSRVIMDRVIPFIEANRDTPFFATVWFHTPHEPVVAGPEYKKMYAQFDDLRQNYYGSITAMDEQVGRLRDKLRELKLEQNTVLFFCSDNGPADPLAKKGVASAGPFKGYKHTMYEGGLLVPACVEWPGTIAPGGATDVRCSTVDFFPTVARIVGYTLPSKDKRPIDGIDLMPIVLTGAAKERGKDLYFGYARFHEGIDGKALISGDHKVLHESVKDGRTRLYDIRNDPHEKHDLAAGNPALLAGMLEKLAAIEHSCQLSRDGYDYRY